MKCKVLIIALISMTSINAQVGIGNPNPDPTSTLDLTNPNERGLLLPSASTVAAMSGSEKMVYYFNDNIYFKTSGGYNALSPWKFKFNTNLTNDVFYNLGGNIGIGNIDITVSPLAPLQIETIGNISLVNNGSLLIGSTLSFNLAVNNTEIQSRNAGSAASLQINEDGGDVTFGSPTSIVNVKATNKLQEYDQTTNSFYDLMPTGMVNMWYGTSVDIPTGWALCDGSTYNKTDGSGTVQAPDLSGKFIVATGNNGTSNYIAHNIGGQDSVAITIAEMPSHNHGGTTSTGGAHSHSVPADGATGVGSGSNGSDKVLNNDDGDSASDPSTSSAGNHNHSIPSDGNGDAHENRPSFYALVYIIKL